MNSIEFFLRWRVCPANAGTDCFDAKCCSELTFAGAGLADEMDDLTAIDEVELCLAIVPIDVITEKTVMNASAFTTHSGMMSSTLSHA